MIMLCLLLAINQPFHQDGPRRPHSQAPVGQNQEEWPKQKIPRGNANQHSQGEGAPTSTHPEPKSRPDSIAESTPEVLLEDLCNPPQDLRAGQPYSAQ